MLRSEDHPPPAGERRLAEAAQRHAPALWDYDVRSGEFLASAPFLRIYGFEPGTPITFHDFIEATHPQDRAWTVAFERADDGAATILAIPYRYRIVRVSDGATRWVSSHIKALRSGTAIVAFTGFVEDVTDEALAVAAASESEERLRLAVEAGKLAVWDVDLETGAISHSLQLNALCGLPPEARPSFSDIRALYAPGEKERLDREGATIEVIRSLAAAGEYDGAPPRRLSEWPALQAEVSIVTPAGEEKRLLLRAVVGPSSTDLPRVTGVLVDITERKRAEERLRVVARELQHRVKNVLALVQAIATQSFRGQTDSEAAMAVYLGRIRALAAATDIVLNEDRADARISAIVANIVEPYRREVADPFDIAGPGVQLAAPAANALAMILHELCTNAAKYGALSVPEGRVAIVWSLESDGVLRVTWKESGSAAGPPGRKGFGLRLIEGLASGDLRGRASLEFAPTGLVCVIVTGPRMVTVAADSAPV